MRDWKKINDGIRYFKFNYQSNFWKFNYPTLSSTNSLTQQFDNLRHTSDCKCWISCSLIQFFYGWRIIIKSSWVFNWFGFWPSKPKQMMFSFSENELKSKKNILISVGFPRGIDTYRHLKRCSCLPEINFLLWKSTMLSNFDFMNIFVESKS